MPTPFLYFIVLQCLKKINGERTIYSIYHLLTGKKSSQTIQDAHLFQLTQYFKTRQSITREQFDDMIEELEQCKYIIQVDEQYYLVTDYALELIDETERQYSFLQHLDGWTYQGADQFWERLSLFVQVTSHIGRMDTNYIPVQRSKQTQSWLKQFLTQNRLKRTELNKRLYQELIDCFEKVPDINPSVLVIRFTGYNAIGLTHKQASEALGIEPTLYHYQFLALLHSIMDLVRSNRVHFPLLCSLASDLGTRNPLTLSTKKTYEMVNRGFSLEEIGRIRNLKVSTIQDHIVELALQVKSFDITPYIDKDKIKRILNAKDKTTTKQLRLIREKVPDASYFEIRLALTRYGDG